MRILLYEYTTGGGLLAEADSPEFRSLLTEGSAMISALAADFAASGRHRVQVLRDARLPHLLFPACEVIDVLRPSDDQRLLTAHAGQADWTMVIAPETHCVLENLARVVLASGGRLLGPSPEFIKIATDKQRTAECLAAAGVLVPHGCTIGAGDRLPQDFDYPAVLKPRDGCGSQDVQLIPDRIAAAQVRPRVTSRLERFCRGLPASVALLCGHGVHLALPPCEQRLSAEGFAYLGGLVPLAPDFAVRAQALAVRAIAALPAACGYVGIDFVLGDSTDGSEDFVIEVNPRLTTSYIGLRALCRENLAEAMLAAASDEQKDLSFRDSRIHFGPDGAISR